jgi:hypothetical protein
MLKDFISEIKKGSLARSNRFAIGFTPPKTAQKPYISGSDPATLRKVILFCDQVQLPGVNFSTVQNRVFGEFRETPYEKLFDTINMSFYVDNDMKVKSLFDNWMNSIQDGTTRTFNYYDNYTTDMTIEVQDINDKTRYQVKLFECYPKTIGSIQMDYASKDVMKLSVTMQYKYWTADTKALLPNGQVVSGNLIDKFTKDFSGFQQSLNNVIGANAGNFVTGAIGSYGVTKLPGLLKF